MGNPKRVWAVTVAVLTLLVFSAPLFAEVSWGKTFVPDTIGPGSVSTLRFDITNGSQTPAEDMAFVDNLPAGVTIATPASASSSCGTGTLSAPDGGSLISLTGGSLGAGQSCSVQVNVTSSTIGTHTNVSGDLTSNDANSGTATDDLTVDTDRPGFSKSFDPASIDAGERSTLTFTIDNSANASLAYNLSFTDDLPAGMVVANPPNAYMDCPVGQLTANPGSSVVSYSSFGGLDASVAAGAICTISVDVTAANRGVLENVSGDLTSTNSLYQTRNSGKAAASLDVSVGTLHLVKEFTDDPVSPGGTVTLEFSIFNRSRDEAATSISFTDDLDATLSGLVAIGLPASDVCGAGSSLGGTAVLTLTGGTLEAGQSCTFSVALQLPAGATPGGYHNETSAVTADVGDVPTDGNSASDTLFLDLAPVLTKEFTDDPVAAGDSVTLEFTITNTSTTSALSDISFEDVFDVILPTASATPANDFCGAGSTAVFIPLINQPSQSSIPASLVISNASLGPDTSCNFSITLDVAPDAASGAYTNTTSEITALLDDESAVIGTSATDDLVIAAAPRLVKEFIDDPVEAGGTTTLRFLISHQSEAPADALSIAFSDDLESTGILGLVATGLPSADVCGTGSSLSGTDTVSLTGGTLAPGESCTIDVTVQVPAGVLPGSYTNTADPLTATVAGLETAGSAASADLLIGGLALTKEFTDDPVKPGDAVTLEFTLTNVTTNTGATNIGFTDNLGSALSGLAAIGLPADDFCGPGSSLSGTSVLTLQNGTLAGGASCTFSATLQVPLATENGSYTNRTSELTATMGGSTVNLPSARDILVVSDQLLDFSKSFNEDSVAPGSDIELTFNIINLSASDTITGISFTDDLDAALGGLVAVPTGLPATPCGTGSSLTGTGILTFAGGELAPGASCQFTATLSVPTDAAYGTLAENTTSMVTGSVGNLAVTGPVAADFFKIHSIELSKSFAAGDVYPGDTTTLSFTLSNLSDQPIERIGFTDDLEAVLPGLMADGLPVSDVCGPGTGSSITGSSVLTYTDTGMEADDICQFDVSILVPGDAVPGSYLNVTSIVTAGGLPTGLPASATLTILERPPGTVTICHKPGTPAEQTKEIDFTDLEDHLGHGDYLGACEESPPAKTLICHKPDTRAEMTKEVDSAALDGHLGHGDYLGECEVGQQKYRIK